MSKASFSEIGTDMETVGKFLKAIDGCSGDFLTAVTESEPLREDLTRFSRRWAEQRVKERLEDYPFEHGAFYYDSRDDIPYDCSESLQLRQVTPSMLKTRNILCSTVEVRISGPESQQSPKKRYWAIVLIDNKGYFHWDFFRTEGSTAIWLKGGVDVFLDFPKDL